jgi:hypothetical protein
MRTLDRASLKIGSGGEKCLPDNPSSMDTLAVAYIAKGTTRLPRMF